MTHFLPFHASKHKCPCISKRGVRCKECENFKDKYGFDKVEEVFEAESEYDVGRTLANDFLDRWEYSANKLVIIPNSKV